MRTKLGIRALPWSGGMARRLDASALSERPPLSASVADLDIKLEVVVIAVSDVDRAKQFYSKLGWRLDADRAAMLVVGAEACYPEVEYGWIQPGRALVDSLAYPFARVSVRGGTGAKLAAGSARLQHPDGRILKFAACLGCVPQPGYPSGRGSSGRKAVRERWQANQREPFV